MDGWMDGEMVDSQRNSIITLWILKFFSHQVFDTLPLNTLMKYIPGVYCRLNTRITKIISLVFGDGTAL